MILSRRYARAERFPKRPPNGCLTDTVASSDNRT